LDLRLDVSLAADLLPTERGERCDIRQAQTQITTLRTGCQGLRLQNKQPVSGCELQWTFRVVQAKGRIQ
jgi:hypothetical protein